MKHDCDTLLSQLSLDLDNLLSPEDSAALDAGLQQCPECRPLFQAMRRADALFRSAPIIAPPYDLSAAVISQIEHGYDRDKRLLGLTLMLGGAMSLWPTMVLLVGVVIALLTATNPGILQGGIDIMVGLLITLHALMMAVGTIGNVLSPWIVPSLSLLFSVVLLALTLVWATRSALAPRPVRA